MNRSRFRTLAGVLGVTLLATAVPVALRVADAAGASCSGRHQVNEQLDGGGRWQFCWSVRELEGVTLYNVRYTPPGGSPIEILGRANLAEIHVPYDTGQPRFFDLSGIGVGKSLMELTASDCPNGTLLQHNEEDIACQTIQPGGYSYKNYGQVGQGETLSLFSVAGMGAYNYIVAWNFDADGTIRPEVGATGALQVIGGPPNRTWPVGPGNSRRAVAHMHNYYWRLDFDINGTTNNDRVEELEALTVPGSQRFELRNRRRVFKREAERRVAPSGFRSWRVRDLATTNADNHPLSVELLPNTDHIYRGPNTAKERFTQRELYVTRFKLCEQTAAENFSSANPNCPRNVAGFANGENIDGRDLVVWYGSSFHHLPRDEDDDHMHPHWTGFEIIPRGLTAKNPVVP